LESPISNVDSQICGSGQSTLEIVNSKIFETQSARC
jgi:hypothetical protein